MGALLPPLRKGTGRGVRASDIRRIPDRVGGGIPTPITYFLYRALYLLYPVVPS
jgi:hypothetical protein